MMNIDKGVIVQWNIFPAVTYNSCFGIVPYSSTIKLYFIMLLYLLSIIEDILVVSELIIWIEEFQETYLWYQN